MLRKKGQRLLATPRCAQDEPYPSVMGSMVSGLENTSIRTLYDLGLSTQPMEH